METHGGSAAKRHWDLDKLILHPYLGFPILLSIMYLIFRFTLGVGDGVQSLFMGSLETLLVEIPRQFLVNHQAPFWLSNSISHGLGQGLQITLGFVPVIAAMFLSLSLLETWGYMARAAQIMDGIMRWVGLSGRSFIPMILGFGCNVPAILATRSLECRRQRILTILMTPFMSCGARLAIYALFVSSFFKGNGHNIIFSLYCIGIGIAILTGWILRKTLLIGNTVMVPPVELPPYRLPNFKSILRITFHRTIRFIFKVGVIIIPVCFLFGILGAFNISDETWFSTLGHSITPFFTPMGITPDNWPATLGLLTGMVAKEVVVGTLTALYSGTNGIQSLAVHFGSDTSAFAYLLFILLYLPCVSVLASIARELNVAWASFTAIWTTGIAYAVAVLFYQLATFTQHPGSSLAWCGGLLGVGILAGGILRYIGRKIGFKNAQKPLPTQILILKS